MSQSTLAPADGSAANAASATPPLAGGLADLVTALATAPPEIVNGTITEALRQVAVRLDLDWAVLWGQERSESRSRAIHHAYRDRPPSAAALGSLLASPGIRSRLDSGLPVSCVEAADPIGAADASRWPQAISVALVPVACHAAGRRLTLVTATATRDHVWTPATIEHLRVIAAAVGQSLTRKADAECLRRIRDDLSALRANAGADVADPHPALGGSSSWGLIASDSPATRQVLAQVEQVARTSSTVLLLGETGVGKERFARAIHELSGRGAREMVRVSCAAIPATLIESELFGRERGAYTGALTRQAGRFEAANGSTLFLDEIGELSGEVQAKLLRALENRVIERLGSNQPIEVDVRIVAATHRNLEQAVANGSFREDLFYRLNVFPVWIPPLRDRVEDIPGLAWKFVDECATAIGKSIHSIASQSMRQLTDYTWPGNIRELRNVIERAVILAKGPVLTIQVPQPPADRAAAATSRLKDVETSHIRRVLESTRWRIRGKDGAAERLGLKPSTLETRMAKLGLMRPKAT